MRPVRLDIDGFASYKGKTVIDFDDVDFFALVGPTGSGKSTILDALSFALYGSAPRWGNVNMVSPALAPTANRALVRLIFDSAGQRYSVVRDVRRGGGKTQAVGIKEQRLERFHNPSDDGAGETDVIESDSRVTAKVTELLGLDFQDFCTCVALPQGEFQKFLHATRKDRQDILSKLLGHQVYERIGTAANSRAKEQVTRAETLTQQLATFSEGGDANVEARRLRVTALAELSRVVTTEALPAYQAAARDAAEWTARSETLSRECAQLAAVSVPADVAELQLARERAADASGAAADALAKAEESDRTARAELAQATPRHQLEALRDQWTELGDLDVRLPGLESAADVAVAAEKAATDVEQAAAGALTAAREAAEVAKNEWEAASKAAAAARDHSAALHGIEAPNGLDDLANLSRSAADALSSARSAAKAAEDKDEAARDELGAAPEAAALTTAGRHARDLAAALRSDVELAPQRAAASAELAALRQRSATAEETLRDAQLHLRAEELGDHVGALRETLSEGSPCPVCEQVVHSIPSREIAVSIDSARAAVTAATDARDRGAHELKAATDKATRLVVAREAAIARAENDRVELLGAVTQLDLPEAELATLSSTRAALDSDNAPLMQSAEQIVRAVTTASEARERLQAAATEATEAARAARKSVAAAEESIKALEARTQTVASELRAARDIVLALGAPAIVETDIARAWAQLTNWAVGRASELQAQLASLEAHAAETATAHTRAKNALAGAERNSKDARESSVKAALARQNADRDLADARARLGQLKLLLDGKPDAAAVEKSIGLVTHLEQTCATAEGTLETARERSKTAAAEAEAATRNAAKGWEVLRRSRDPLIGYGAPAIGPETESLGEEWRTFASWAAAEASARSTQLEDVSHRAATASEKAAAADQQLRLLLTDQDIDPGLGLVADRVASLLAAAEVRADAALTRAKEHQEAVARLRKQIDDATEQSQVARELALLMRSNNFPQWLVNSALDALISEASTVLYELSGGQFHLTADDGNLIVIDHNNADLTRSVKTLSGGETFQASLALALALSRQMSALAASGATKLEAIFLDEGFGTLDADTLDEVATTLENLAASGSRMVGVVTHVPALADRIPVRFRVHRDDAGSHVTAERT